MWTVIRDWIQFWISTEQQGTNCLWQWLNVTSVKCVKGKVLLCCKVKLLQWNLLLSATLELRLLKLTCLLSGAFSQKCCSYKKAASWWLKFDFRHQELFNAAWTSSHLMRWTIISDRCVSLQFCWVCWRHAPRRRWRGLSGTTPRCPATTSSGWGTTPLWTSSGCFWSQPTQSEWWVSLHARG